jgi:hypothetical protein
MIWGGGHKELYTYSSHVHCPYHEGLHCIQIGMFVMVSSHVVTIGKPGFS